MKTIIEILFPPYAVCRYGCLGYCAIPISVLWLGSLITLGYYFFAAPKDNDLLYTGSLYLGLAMLATSIIWTRSSNKRAETDLCNSTDSDRKGPICRVLPGVNEQDPLEVAERSKNL